MIEYMQKVLLYEIMQEYPMKFFDDQNLIMCLNEILSQKHESFIFVIDEWDCVIRNERYGRDDKKIL